MIITIIGLGVIGGSFAKALKGKGYTVYGVDIDQRCIDMALEDGTIEEGFTDPTEILKKTDLTLICLYPSKVIDFLKTYEFKKGSIVSDCVGIKSYFLKEALEILPEDIEYISVHPMAGKESKGYEFASAEVYIGANFIIVEHEKNHKDKIAWMEEFVSSLGFRSVRIMSPEDHDAIISFTSQLPHTIAISLINSDDQRFDTGKYIGDSYRDLTRICNINEDLWAELFLNNKEALFESIQKFENQLDLMKEAIRNNDEEKLKAYFIEGRKRRAKL